MCGIAGYVNWKEDYLSNSGKYNFQRNILKDMCDKLYHRGPDEQGVDVDRHSCLAHTRLSIIDLENGQQPMFRNENGNTYKIVYNGEIYNTAELKKDLVEKGYTFFTTSDTEVILVGYIEYGINITKRLNGIFAFCIIDEMKREAYLVRDQIGVKPLYYTIFDSTLIFSSEIKGIFCYPGLKPEIDKDGLNEIFALGPAKTSGSGVFKNIWEIKPGEYLRFSQCDFSGFIGMEIFREKYWQLYACEHRDDYETTLEKTRSLVIDAIERQMVSDVPIATFLSGGVDSSIVSSVCAGKLSEENKRLGTFSFDFKDNDKFFKANSFQPSQDRPYVDIMKDYMESEHHYLWCDNSEQYNNLFTSVDVRDLPTMADVDSSMLYFCKLVKPFYKVVLTGECADEIFGGYPWFHKKECFEAQMFPWSMDMDARKTLLKQEIIEQLGMDEYARSAYDYTIKETPLLIGEDETEKRRREISYLNMRWFMQTLLDRMDRASMYSGLEARVPFADINIVQYLYNVPWKYKAKGGMEKSLLRNAVKGLLPEEVLFRKKSPYPKTYDPGYEKLLIEKFTEVIDNQSSPINRFVDKKKAYNFMKEKKDYGRPWYGQLMAGPQMLAYMLQVNYWMEKWSV